MDLDKIGDRWDQLDELFEQAISLPTDEVEDFCRRACGDDQELKAFLSDLVTAVDMGDEQVRDSITLLAQDVAQFAQLTGQRVGAYHIDELLARGGMGEVYLASRADGEFEKKVVLKVVQSKLNRDEFVRHFRTERQVLANLSHPSIPALIDAGQLDDGRPWFVTEYVRGEPIDAFCESRKTPTKERIVLVEEVGRAVQHAHNRLVLHLDIKPDNILIEHDGTPKLLDFGVARLIGETDTGHQAFTPEYASPEQLRGDAPTVASDIYSLGVLLFRLVTGELPFEAPRFAPASTKIADRAQLVRRLRSPETLAGLDKDLRAVLARAMADDVAERYSSIESLLLDLYRYRNHRPVSARERTLGYRFAKYARRNTLPLAITIGVFVMLVSFGLREAALRKQAQSASLLAAQEAETSRQVSTFLTELFEVSDPGEARGNSVTARELLDKGAERIGGDLIDRPLVATQLMRVMGNVYVSLGLYDDAAPLLEAALTRREAALRDDDAELARILTSLGSVYRRLARFDDAEPPLLRGLAIREQLLAADNVEIAESLQALGDFYMRHGRFDDAVSAHLRGIRIRAATQGPDHPDHAVHLFSLAMVYSDLGRNEESEELYLRAIDILERAWGRDHPDLANLLESLGNLYTNSKRLDEAVPYLERGLALREKALDPEHPLVSYSLMNISAMYANGGQLDKAEGYLLRAIAIQENAFEPDDYRLALSRYNLGDIYYDRGLIDEAQEIGLIAHASLTKRLRPDHPFIGFASKLLADTYFKQERLEEAEAYYRQAFAVFGPRPVDDPVRQDTVAGYVAFLRASGRDEDADAIQ